MFGINDVLNWVRPSRTLPQAAIDGSMPAAIRGGSYGEIYGIPIFSDRKALAEEGSLFTWATATPDTGIQINTNVTAFSDTNAFLVVQNSEDLGNKLGKNIFLDRLKIIPTGTLPTATLSMHFAGKLGKTSRLPAAAGRTQLTANTNNPASGRTSIGNYFTIANGAAMTVAASDAAVDKNIGRCIIPTGLGILGDEYEIVWGGVDPATRPPLTAARATDVGKLVGHMPAVVIPPGYIYVLHMWWKTAATTAATFEVIGESIER